MNIRENNLNKLSEDEIYDVLILGGGINGAVAAASLAAKGVSVALIEKGDFACETSSNSSNLAWGGIKYLESYELLLVNNLCKSRNRLMRSYPSTVKEVRFLTTVAKGFRYPPFLIYLGAILYWFIGRCFTKKPTFLSCRQLIKKDPSINVIDVAGGLEYSDCFLYDNDARFVFNFIRSALDYGCIAVNYVESQGAVREGDVWVTQARDNITGNQFRIRSKVLINACGPHVDLHNELTSQLTAHRHLFSKGVHLIVDRLTVSDKVLAFFASDGRLFFVIPMGPKTCIGTTDSQVDTPNVSVEPDDRTFILDNANRLLNLSRPLTVEDIIAERCGVRPLAVKGSDGVADWIKLSRKHAIDVNERDRHVSIFGGKLTDCINVGDEVAKIVAQLGVNIPFANKIWYGESSKAIKKEFFHQATLMNLDKFTDVASSEPLTQRLWRRYGADALQMLEDIRNDPENSKVLIENAEYLRCELRYAAQSEMVTKLEDFLRRRSKIELVVRRSDIINGEGIVEACDILFGDQAEKKLQEYLESFEQSPRAH